jgi:hypothetical protein
MDDDDHDTEEVRGEGEHGHVTGASPTLSPAKKAAIGPSHVLAHPPFPALSPSLPVLSSPFFSAMEKA